MEPPVSKIKQKDTPKEQFKENGKLYFLSKNYENIEYCSKDTEIVNSGCFDRNNVESSIFWSKFKDSKSITIIDNFFSKNEINKIVKILKKSDISKKLDFKIFELFTGKYRENKEFICEINQILKDKFAVYELYDSYIHDRFAILDNELFHFGGTVGGKAEEGFTAYSCGWDANKIDLLIKQIKSCSKIAKRRM